MGIGLCVETAQPSPQHQSVQAFYMLTSCCSVQVQLVDAAARTRTATEVVSGMRARTLGRNLRDRIPARLTVAVIEEATVLLASWLEHRESAVWSHSRFDLNSRVMRLRLIGHQSGDADLSMKRELRVGWSRGPFALLTEIDSSITCMCFCKNRKSSQRKGSSGACLLWRAIFQSLCIKRP